MSGQEEWRPARQTRAQRTWQPGQQKKPASIRVLFGSVVLGLESLVLVFYGLAVSNLHRGEAIAPWILVVSLALAVVAVATCALLRRPVGYWIGWGLQVVLIAGAFLEITMLFVGVGFALAWTYAVLKGGQLDRENVQRRAAEERWRREHPEADPGH